MKASTNNTAPIRKPSASGVKPRQPRKGTGKAKQAKPTKEAPKAALVKAPTSFADIKLTKTGKRTVEAEIKAQMVKLSAGVESTLRAYCAIGDALVIAKAAVETAGGSFVKFMKPMPLGLAYSTAQRYIKASEFGADKAIESFKSGGAETLNFKSLLSDMTEKDNEAKGKAQNGNRKPRVSTPPPSADQPVKGVAGLAPVGAVTDEAVDSVIDTYVPSMSAAQVGRLMLALQVRQDEITAADKVIEAA